MNKIVRIFPVVLIICGQWIFGMELERVSVVVQPAGEVPRFNLQEFAQLIAQEIPSPDIAKELIGKYGALDPRFVAMVNEAYRRFIIFKDTVEQDPDPLDFDERLQNRITEIKVLAELNPQYIERYDQYTLALTKWVRAQQYLHTLYRLKNYIQDLKIAAHNTNDHVLTLAASKLNGLFRERYGASVEDYYNKLTRNLLRPLETNWRTLEQQLVNDRIPLFLPPTTEVAPE